MLYLNSYEISEEVKEITITYKKDKLDEASLAEIIDFILDEYNYMQQDLDFER